MDSGRRISPLLFLRRVKVLITLKKRILTQSRREPVTYDELLLPNEAPGNRDRRGDLSECKQFL
jgi:hypothetical protein